MDLNQLVVKQKYLDDVVIKNYNSNHSDKLGFYLDHKDFITHRLLGLVVELAEVCNEQDLHKYWKNNKKVGGNTLEELADVLHFLLSITHTLGYSGADLETAYLEKFKENLRRQENGY